ncbi:MAG TPA: hypothetical protein VM260_00690 [Pirellula sp.]|nr:hypothetical protein [Pirellula sp.]
MSAKSHTDSDWLTPEVKEFLRDLDYNFQVRVFGEEMARVNFLPLEERRAYYRDLIDYARSTGVNYEKPAPGYTR